MAKQINKKPAPVLQPKQKIVVEKNPIVAGLSVTDVRFPAWVSDFKIQAAIVAILAFVLYCNTFNHESAHDDTMVIVQNEYVLEGFAGIHDIFTKDAYDSYYKQFNSGNQLSGGRYRPLSIITFAVEQQFFGTVRKDKIDSFLNHPLPAPGTVDPWKARFLKNMHIRHVFNVAWYALSVVVFLYFLRLIVFRSSPVMALLTATIFTAHPIHTEVVANVKSRDEIMSLMFMCLTFILAFKYEEDKKKWVLGLGLFTYLLAFLSKEYAITMIALLPLALVLFNTYTIPQSIKATLPFVILAGSYIFIRSQIVGGTVNENSSSEILNNPYFFASGPGEKLATEISTTLNYLKLLIFPHPLSADYSYNTIPYVDFTNWLVWVSLIVHGGLIYGFFYYLKRRHVLSFAIAFYFSHLLMICNIVFDIGATMGERLIYHSSVGFAMAAAYFLYKGMERIKPESMGKTALAGFMVVLTGLYSFKTIDRNRAWKNDEILFNTDLKTVPNSVLVNANVAAALIDKSETEKTEEQKKRDIHEGIAYLDKAISLHKTYVSSYLNKALAYFKLRQPDSVVINLDVVRRMYPNHPKLPEMYYNAGVNFYLNKQYPQAVSAWQITLKLKPDFTQAQNALNVLHNSGVQ
jgi:hypothetical protein